MDPRQRSAERRRFRRIGFAFVIGLGSIVLAAGAQALGLDEAEGRGGRSVFLGYVFGAGWIGAGLYELARRLVTGPTKPGKRARY
ncbi:hypothetical protein ACFJIY_21410 [Pimelobacter simplex]|uniref:hypothetical protein n=1 Tax=Nocardioides simplex TaxID=2045 RepID=UPI00366E414C